MNIDELRASLEAGRRLELALDGAVFELRLPTEWQWRLAAEEHKAANGQTQGGRAVRQVLEEAIVGWRGVAPASFDPALPGEPNVMFSKEAAALLLDARQDVADAIFAELARRSVARRDSIEAARKNSARA